MQRAGSTVGLHAAPRMPSRLWVPLRTPRSCKAQLKEPVLRDGGGTVAVPSGGATAPPSSTNTSVSAQYRPFLDAWDRGFTFNHREEPQGMWLEVVEGRLPAQL
ncbi:uncharacterized protein HaLaN_26206, partial [Haematococcus lacustris]